jgi:hypothetical protein
VVVSRLTTAFLVAITLPTLAGCSETVTHRERIPFSRGNVELVITSVGSALGDERYELKFMNGSEAQTFFRGANFSEFQATERDGKFAIQMCKGWIDLAEPIGVGESDNFNVVRLDLNWNCLDKRHAA